MRPPADNHGDHQELKKGAWTPDEDQKLIDYIDNHGQGCWQLLPKKAGLNRCGKSCRLRWTNYLRPDIKRGNFSPHEEQTIIDLHSVLGNKWSMIASRLPGRTDNEIKNYWNTHLRKRLIRSGIDPKTHQPIINYDPTMPSSSINSLIMSNINGPLESLAKIKLLCGILQVLQANPNPNPAPVPIPLAPPETLINQFGGLMNGEAVQTPLFQVSSWMEATLNDPPVQMENQVVFDTFGGMMPKLVDSTSNSGVAAEDLCGNQLVHSDGDDLEQILNYKLQAFGSDKCDDVWGEVIDGEATAAPGGSSSCWKDVVNEFFFSAS